MESPGQERWCPSTSVYDESRGSGDAGAENDVCETLMGNECWAEIDCNEGPILHDRRADYHLVVAGMPMIVTWERYALMEDVKLNLSAPLMRNIALVRCVWKVTACRSRLFADTECGAGERYVTACVKQARFAPAHFGGHYHF